jgi:segregation and condensation protein B
MYPNTTQLLPQASLDARIEALLFTSGSAIKRSSLIRILGVSEAELAEALIQLKERLTRGGTAIIETEGAIALTTSPSMAETVQAVRKNQTQEDIGQAALEVLSVILYRENATRAGIDYIRGVNSAATIRALTMRGLIERVPNKNGNEAETLYRITPALLAHLGVTHVSDIPGRDVTLKELEAFDARSQNIQNAEETPSVEEDETDLSYDEDAN